MEKVPPREGRAPSAERPAPINSRKELFREFPEVSGNHLTTPPAFSSPYKTAQEKIEYANRLPTEILPFVRAYFAKYKDQILEQSEGESLSEYLKNIKDAWSEHIEANKAIDIFLSYETNNAFGDWSMEEWRMARRLLGAAFDSDHKKTMYSGGVKHKLELERARLSEKYRSSGIEDLDTLLISPAGLTFYEGRLLDNKKLHLALLKGEDSSELQEDVISRYNGGDVDLFKSRFKEFNFSNDVNLLEAEIGAMEAMVKERSIKKNYALVGRQDLKDFDSLLDFDNRVEYEYTYSLKGLPDLFLREEVLRRLTKDQELPPETSVYSLSKEDFFEAIDRRLSRLERHSQIRLRPYHQTTMNTCGTACIMPILSRKGVPLSREVELDIWDRVGKPYNFPGGLASVLLEHGFHVEYVQDKPTLLQTENPEFESSDSQLLAAAINYTSLHEKAVQEGLDFSVKNWDFDTVKGEISKGNPCILYVYVSPVYTHCVVARGIKNDRLEMIDPLGDIKFMDREELDKRIETPMGRRMLVIQKLPTDFFDKLSANLESIGY